MTQRVPEVFPPPTPVLGKIETLQNQSEPVGRFLEWLFEQGYYICQYNQGTEEYWPVSKQINSWLAQHFEIDEREAENERRALLEYIRAATENRQKAEGEDV